MKTEMGLELIERESKGAGAVNEPIIIAREGYGLPLLAEKVHRRQMKRVQSSHRLRKGLQCPCQYGRGEFDQGQTAEQRADFVRVRSRQFPRMNPGPNLILDQPAGDQRL